MGYADVRRSESTPAKYTCTLRHYLLDVTSSLQLVLSAVKSLAVLHFGVIYMFWSFGSIDRILSNSEIHTTVLIKNRPDKLNK